MQYVYASMWLLFIKKIIYHQLEGKKAWSKSVSFWS